MSDESGDSNQPLPEGFDSWSAYWATQGMPWRTEPEIDAERQAYLAERRAVKVDIEKRVYPFQDANGSIKLTRADVEWLLATHDSAGMHGPVNWGDEQHRHRPGLNLSGADLAGQDLRGLPLSRLVAVSSSTQLGNTDLRSAQLNQAKLDGSALHGARLSDASLQDASLLGIDAHDSDWKDAHLERASFPGAHLSRANFDAAHLENANLTFAQLTRASLDGAHLEGAFLVGANVEGANLRGAHLECASLMGANLREVMLYEAHMAGVKCIRDVLLLPGGTDDILDYIALVQGYERLRQRVRPEVKSQSSVGSDNNYGYLPSTHLEGANLARAYLAGRRMDAKDLERVRAWGVDCPDTVPPADLRLVYFDSSTYFLRTKLGDRQYGSVALFGVRWGGANLAAIEWQEVEVLGDELMSRQYQAKHRASASRKERLDDMQAATRAYRQLSSELREQGLREDADRFAYRAQLLQRKVLQRQGRLERALGSWLLDAISGYGYKPMRSVFTYLLVILTFAAAYFTLTNFALTPSLSSHSSPLAWYEALVLSVSSFHGRGLFPTGLSLGDPIAILAAFEAIIGLLIEITFIATFTQRFFAR